MEPGGSVYPQLRPERARLGRRRGTLARMPRRPGSSSRLRPPTVAPPLVLARDHSPERIARMLADGSLTRLHRGAYVRPLPTESPTDRMVARIAAVHHLAQVDHCFSHASAAILHGLPL
jgi:hypothetical protein